MVAAKPYRVLCQASSGWPLSGTQSKGKVSWTHCFHSSEASGSGITGTRIFHLWNSSNLMSLCCSREGASILQWSEGLQATRMPTNRILGISQNLDLQVRCLILHHLCWDSLLTWEWAWWGTILVRAANTFQPTHSSVVFGLLQSIPHILVKCLWNEETMECGRSNSTQPTHHLYLTHPSCNLFCFFFSTFQSPRGKFGSSLWSQHWVQSWG